MLVEYSQILPLLLNSQQQSQAALDGEGINELNYVSCAHRCDGIDQCMGSCEQVGGGCTVYV